MSERERREMESILDDLYSAHLAFDDQETIDDAWDWMYDAINAAAAFMRKPRNPWTRVEDGLPEWGDEVDVWAAGKRVPRAWLDGTTPADPTPVWRVVNERFGVVEELDGVTHWQPITSPEGQSND